MAEASATLDMLGIDIERLGARDTLEESIEPYLIQEGFLVRTPRGCQITELDRLHTLLTEPER